MTAVVDLMTEIIAHTRALDASVTKWLEDQDRKAAADALSRCRVLDLRVRKLHDQLTEDVQRYDREHSEHDPRD